MNKDKFFHNQQERIQDELVQTKADALRKGLIGGQLKNFIQPGAAAQTAGPGNPFGKLLAGTMRNQAQGQNASQTSSGNPLAEMMSKSMALPQSGPKPPQKTPGPVNLGGTNALLNQQPKEFIYEYDFDENGALYYLGSFGKKRIW